MPQYQQFVIETEYMPPQETRPNAPTRVQEHV